MASSENISHLKFGPEQLCQQKQKKAAKLRKRGSAKSKAAANRSAAETALQKEQRMAVLEQLRGMVGCEPGCGQFEIVQRVIHYISQLNQQLQCTQQCSPNEEDDGMGEGPIGGRDEFSSAAFNQLVAGLSMVWNQGKKASKTNMPRAQRTR